jgi:diguanylate cyclase (GGDEF)-like protein
VTAVPVVWFLFALHFSNRSEWVKKWKIILLAVIPTITMSLMITNENHHLFLKGIIFIRNNGYLNDITWQLGPWFWVHLVYSYFLILIADFILLKEAFRLSSSYRKQTYALIFGTLFPLIINLLFTFHLIPTLQVNYDPLGFVIAGLVFAAGLFQWRLLDLRPIAHQLVVESMQDAVFVIDNKERIVEVNPAAERIFDQQKENIIGQEAGLIFPKIKLNHGHGKSFTFHLQNASKNIYDAQLSPITNKGQNYGYLLILRDISEQKKLENQLIQLANHDPLTGLSNRKFFITEANKELNRAIRYQSPYVLGFMDLDNFKAVNDLYGHAAGDTVLKKIATIIQNELRIFDLAGRYGGDEFVFVFPQTNRFEAEQIIQRLVTKISNIQEVESHQPITVSASVGLVSLEEQQHRDLLTLIKLADEKMYETKRLRKNIRLP